MASPTRRRPEHGLPGQMNQDIAQNIQNGYGAAVAGGAEAKPSVSAELEAVVRFMEDVLVEVDDATTPNAPNPYLNMSLHLLRRHLEGRMVIPSSIIAASGVPYATATRKLTELLESGAVEQRPRSKTGKSVSLHPSPEMLDNWCQLARRIHRLAAVRFGADGFTQENSDYY